MDKLNKYLLVVIATILLLGCTTTPQLANMVPYIPNENYYHSNKSLKLGEIVGGEKSDPLFKGSRIDAISLRGALSIAIQNSHMFQLLNFNQEANYLLNVMILSQNQPALGLDMSVSLTVRYYLIDGATKQVIWSNDITSIYTAKFSDSLIGASRLNMANEGAVRENIVIFLHEISSLRL